MGQNASKELVSLVEFEKPSGADVTLSELEPLTNGISVDIVPLKSMEWLPMAGDCVVLVIDGLMVSVSLVVFRFAVSLVLRDGNSTVGLTVGTTSIK